MKIVIGLAVLLALTMWALIAYGAYWAVSTGHRAVVRDFGNQAQVK